LTSGRDAAGLPAGWRRREYRNPNLETCLPAGRYETNSKLEIQSTKREVSDRRVPMICLTEGLRHSYFEI